MALKTFVKISNVNNLSDARYCSGMYVDLMGFALETTDENYLSPDAFKEITDWLSGLQYVGEFTTSEPSFILEQISAYDGIQYIQVEEENHLQKLAHSGYKLILNKGVDNDEQLRELLPLAQRLKETDVILLIDSSDPGLYDNPDWNVVREIAQNCDVLLGFGFNADTVEMILETTQVKGIAIKGGKEIKPGIKDFDELADTLEKLEIED
ncbi:phosphoribosylanthranilate isomerase [Lunatibacter salilacus]|uniref:phosphoribosylanthranilate isomerase n=1 Tax=Lunatibacter salilacus TaxID=2483804 RepID=UPI00131C61D3|nr:phosphoribosylanthranilate isomerase [Lunatibacter salilacus]